LVIAVLGYAVLSGMLILKLGGFEGTKRRAQEAEATLERVRTELSSLQVEVNSLEGQRGAYKLISRFTYPAQFQALRETLI
jgi:hypothetical protein